MTSKENVEALNQLKPTLAELENTHLKLKQKLDQERLAKAELDVENNRLCEELALRSLLHETELKQK